MSNKKVSYAKNIQSINLIINKERKGQSNFYTSVIENCGTTLANRLIDYIKKVEIQIISHLIMRLKGSHYII